MTLRSTPLEVGESDGLLATMEALEALLGQETALVRAGKLAEAAALEARKAELTAAFLTDSRRLKTGAGQSPEAVRALLRDTRSRHTRLREVLQLNMVVLATAHAVAEGLIRGAVGEVNRKSTPQTYGAAGRATVPPPSHSRPVVFNRNC